LKNFAEILPKSNGKIGNKRENQKEYTVLAVRKQGYEGFGANLPERLAQ